MANKIQMDEFAEAIKEALQEYELDSIEKLKQGFNKLAKETVKELKSTSPKSKKHGGQYAKGWGSTVTNDSAFDISITVHQKKKVGLTHLLEHGHAKVNGGRVAARPHIEQAEKNMISRAEEVAKEAYGE